MSFQEQVKQFQPDADKAGFPDTGKSVMAGGPGKETGPDLGLGRADPPAKKAFFFKYKAARTAWLNDPKAAGMHKWEASIGYKSKAFSLALKGEAKGSPAGVKSIGGTLSGELKLGKQNTLFANASVSGKPKDGDWSKVKGDANANIGIRHTIDTGKKDKAPDPRFAAGYVEPAADNAALDAAYAALEAAVEAENWESAAALVDEIEAALKEMP